MRRAWMVGAITAAGLAARTGAGAAEPLPEGHSGIAAEYEGDEGIGSHPDVILFEDFEGYASSEELEAQWESVHHHEWLTFDTEGDGLFAGAQSMRMTVPQQEGELSNGLTKWVAPELDVLFLRYYTRFDAPYDVVGSSHNGSMISAHYYEGHQATPGVPANGTNKWLVNLENWRGEASTPSPGLLNVYVYHPDQRSDYGDHFFPTGLVMPNTSLPFDFGEDFVPMDDFVPELQRWYCWEFMVQANTPGASDGRIAAWIDGDLVADWTNVRLRDVPDLTIDRFGIGFHIGSNPAGETRKWYDNVVAAHSYIGPIGDGSGGGDTGAGDTGGDADTGADPGGSDDGADPSAGDDGGGGEGDAGPDDEGDAGPGDDGGAGADGEGSGGPGPDAEADEDGGGCGCQSPGEGPAGYGAWLVLGLGLGLTRRRRRARRPAQ